MKYVRRSTVEYNSINQADFFVAKIKIKWRFRNGYVHYIILRIFINFNGFYLHNAIIQRVSSKCWKCILRAQRLTIPLKIMSDVKMFGNVPA